MKSCWRICRGIRTAAYVIWVVMLSYLIGPSLLAHDQVGEPRGKQQMVLKHLQRGLAELGLASDERCESFIDEADTFATVYLSCVSFMGSQNVFAAHVPVSTADDSEEREEDPLKVYVTDMASIGASNELAKIVVKAREAFKREYKVPSVKYEVSLVVIERECYEVGFQRVNRRGAESSNVAVRLPRELKGIGGK